MKNKLLLLLTLVLTAWLGACSQSGSIKKDTGKAAAASGVLSLPENVPYRSVAPFQISSHDELNFYVRWAGVIQEYRYLEDKNETCIRVAGQEDSAAGVSAISDMQVRNEFWACMPGKYDKIDLKIDNYVRLVGKVVGFMHNRPLVKVEKILVMDRGGPAHTDGGLIYRAPRRIQ
jgi:hypothetical protein